MPGDTNPPRPSRRTFLSSTAGAAGVPFLAPDESEPGPFRPNTKPEKLSDHLFLLEDTCNVYLIRSGNRGLLIDFGSGHILNHLRDLQVTAIDWILHTHHHRDQAQGDLLAADRGISIAVPEQERQFFADAENFWRNRRIFELYDVRNDFFSLTKNVPVAGVLRDYETFEWRRLNIFVQPTPGHTPGSITLVTQVDNQRVAFSGDLMHSAGKVQTLYDLQYYYGEHEGVDLSIYSLSELGQHKPDLLCPSHGRPMRDPLPGMEDLSRNLRQWHAYWYKHPPTIDLEPVAVSPHLTASTETTSSFYAIISDSGKGLFVDYGAASWTFFQVYTRYADTFGHMRFLEHTIGKLRARHGLRAIEIAMPSHTHDDHVNGFPYLARRYGTKIWAYENMVEVLESPRALNIGCIYGEPVKVDRSLRDRETFKWEEFEFTVVHSPGHTNYQMAMFTTIDGNRIAFTGDAFFNDPDHPQSLRHNLIYRNEVRSGDHVKSIRNILEFEPHLIAPGHGKPFAVDRTAAEAFEARARKQDSYFRDLIADPDPDVGIYPFFVRLFPYQASVAAGDSKVLQIRIRNPRTRVIHLEAALVPPSGWTTTPAIVTADVPPQSEAVKEVSFTVPPNWSSPVSRVALALDIVRDGQYLGQIAECVVDVRSTRPKGNLE